MKFLFLNRRPVLDAWEKRPFSLGVLDGPRASDNFDRHAAVVGSERPGEPQPDGPFRRVAQAIAAYRIFPPRLVERVLRRTPIQVGDTVGMSYRIGPGARMFMACRVIDVFDGLKDGVWRSGFTYRTLPGHAALGDETFAVEKDLATGEVTVSLTAWSRPGHWLMRVGYPYARWCQRHAGRAALANLKAAATDTANPAAVG
jgi:uncharacterized protein (UPF0548 family)